MSRGVGACDNSRLGCRDWIEGFSREHWQLEESDCICQERLSVVLSWDGHLVCIRISVSNKSRRKWKVRAGETGKGLGCGASSIISPLLFVDLTEASIYSNGFPELDCGREKIGQNGTFLWGQVITRITCGD